jgi:hypothetical protein
MMKFWGKQDYDYFTDEIDASFAQQHISGAESERSQTSKAPMQVLKPNTYKEPIAKGIFSNTLKEGTPSETGVLSSSKGEITPQRERVHSNPIKGVHSSTITGVHSSTLQEYTPNREGVNLRQSQKTTRERNEGTPCTLHGATSGNEHIKDPKETCYIPSDIRR